ncbi:hypothetical protein XM25_15135 [Devosia sp. H5989]|nr:hypothetical protein XM25_15135 [Devosia sp. H5989]
MSFVPANSDNAIAAVTFQLILDRVLSPKTIQAANAVPERWTDDLPAIGIAKALNVGVEAEGPSQVTEQGGVSFAFMRPDGTPAWVFRALHQSIVVECARYSRWKNVVSAAARYVSEFTEVMKREADPASAVIATLLVRDEFHWKGDLGDYDSRQLLNQSSHVAEIARGNNPVWHSYTGWFPDPSVLMHLNVTGTRIDNHTAASREGTAEVTIDHYMQKSLTPAASAADMTSEWYASVMSELHELNKQIMKEILTDSAREMIGLGNK